MESTNLCRVKETAQCLLRLKVHKTQMSPMIVQHPFTSSGLKMLPGTGQIVDITADENSLLKWQCVMDAAIEKAKSAYEIFMMINKPYGLTFLKFTKNDLSTQDLSYILADAWMQSENPNMDIDVSKSELVAMFKQTDKQYLMTSEERGHLATLGERVTVYRGVTSYNAKNVRALSWTTDRKKAEWFAHRFNENGTVYTARIKQAHILAMFMRRGESEIVLNPRGLEELKKTEGL